MMRGFFAETPKRARRSGDDGRSLQAWGVRQGHRADGGRPPGRHLGALLHLSWNEYPYAFILVAFEGRPLTVGIPGLITPHGTLWGQVAAVAVVATLPILVFTFLVQKHLVRGLTFGAVKG